ncbi:helix-turn-helix domain-containing protein [Bradyrhizobium sp.]|uniref:helix-turn-helix domain-containing protein n=1 Tax=Bradyrhizobium sp. TaxID=376 RepID=UPI002911D15E|nr:helix-turn-helix domain-containing protein [Bradyrhizobium sp.]MDU6139065.1 helix-turn-helix domain-containing protein [Bradyrhizobium sp.]
MLSVPYYAMDIIKGLVLALALLAEGRSVTQVAMEMGYDSSAAFSTMFRRVLGQAPSSYLTEDGRDG